MCAGFLSSWQFVVAHWPTSRRRSQSSKWLFVFFATVIRRGWSFRARFRECHAPTGDERHLTVGRHAGLELVISLDFLFVRSLEHFQLPDVGTSERHHRDIKDMRHGTFGIASFCSWGWDRSTHRLTEAEIYVPASTSLQWCKVELWLWSIFRKCANIETRKVDLHCNYMFDKSSKNLSNL